MARPKTYPEDRVVQAVRMPKDLQQRLHEAADARDLSANFLAVKAITLYLDELVPADEVSARRHDLAS
jgi:hypothetical protein